MTFALPVGLAQTTSSIYNQPGYFVPIFFFFLFAGGILALVAFIYGRSRVKKAGPAAKWFSLASLGILLYYLQWLGLAFALLKQNMSVIWLMLSFHTLFLFVAAICTIAGFKQMTDLEVVGAPPPDPPKFD
jgi:protein-S-isoprenylcysteine O-methyltransferase Ste14